MGKIKYF